MSSSNSLGNTNNNNNHDKNSSKNNRILLVLPTYNNAATLLEVIDSSKKYIEDILVVDDGSTDGTADILKHSTGVTVLTHEKNLGKGGALLSGFHYAKKHGFSHIITMDTDGQHFAEDIPKFATSILQTPDKIIIGNRDFSTGPHILNSSKFGRKFSNFWIKIETGKSLPDTQSGYRAYPVCDFIFKDLKAKSYDFEIEILVYAAWSGMDFMSIPISVFYPPADERISHFKPFLDNFRLSIMHTRLVLKRLFIILINLFTLKYIFASRQTQNTQKNLPEHIQKERKGAFLMPICWKYFGISFCYFFAPFVLLFYFFLNRVPRNGILIFYKNLGEKNFLYRYFKSFQNYLYFAASLLDRISFAHGNVKFKVVMQERNFTTSTIADEATIIIGSHLGDWTFCSEAFNKKQSQTIAIVVDESATQKFQELLKKQNFYSKLRIVNASQDSIALILELKELVQQKATICFLGDRVFAKTPKVATTFFGKNINICAGPFQIGQLFSCPIYSFFCVKNSYSPSGDYKVFVYPIRGAKEQVNLEQMAQTFVNQLERLVRLYPQNWFNFYDIWKTENE